MEIQRTTPFDVAHLLPVLDHMLIELLNELRETDWHRHTMATPRTVRDIAGQLLDANIRLLSSLRDAQAVDQSYGDSYRDLVRFLDRLNADSARAMERVSPQMLILLLEVSGAAACEYLQSLKASEPSHFPVEWAGESQSLNWMAVAQEYTNKWVCQQQIRDAVGRPGLMTRELFHPAMEHFMRTLPQAYRRIHAAEGTTVELCVRSEVGGSWWIRRHIGRWKPAKAPDATPDARIELHPDTAWKLFSKSVRPETIRDLVRIEGDTVLAEVALGLVAELA